MADDLGVEFFKAARSQLDQIVKWHLIVLAALLYFHIGIVAPFAAKSAAKAALDGDLERQRAVAAAVAPVPGLTKALSDEVRESAKHISDIMLSDLVARFGRLNEVVAHLTGMSEEDAAGQRGEAEFTLAGDQEQQQIQQQQQQQIQQVILPPMAPDLRQRIAQGKNNSMAANQYKPQLEEYIQTSVVQPAFGETNEAWRQQFLPGIDNRATEALDAIAQAKTAARGSSESLIALEGSVGTLAKAAQDFKFVAPADSDWWRTITAKEDTIKALTQSLADQIRGAATPLVSVESLLQKANDTIGQEEQATQAITTELARLDEAAKTLQAQLGEIGSPLKIVAFPLALLAPLLPVIVAVASGVATLMTAEALRKMCLAASLAPIADRAKLRPWLADAAGRNWPFMLLRALLLAAVMVLWILAAHRATQLLEPPFLSGTRTVQLALAAYLGCRLWLWLRAARALRQARAPGADYRE